MYKKELLCFLCDKAKMSQREAEKSILTAYRIATCAKTINPPTKGCSIVGISRHLNRQDPAIVRIISEMWTDIMENLSADDPEASIYEQARIASEKIRKTGA